MWHDCGMCVVSVPATGPPLRSSSGGPVLPRAAQRCPLFLRVGVIAVTLLCSAMPVPSKALVVPAEQPVDATSHDGWTSTLAVVMTVATLVTMIKMVATCSSCFGKPGNGVGGGDEVTAFEVPGADVRQWSTGRCCAVVCDRDSCRGCAIVVSVWRAATSTNASNVFARLRSRTKAPRRSVAPSPS